MSSCKPGVKVSDLKFENARKKNLDEINKYYADINTNFDTQFNEIKEAIKSNDNSELAKVESNMNDPESDIRLLNNHLVEVNHEMNKMVKTDFSTIDKLLKEIKEQDKVLKNNEMEIDKLYKLLKSEEVEDMKNKDSIRDTKLFNKKVKQYHDTLIFFNVLVFMVIIVGIYSLVYPKAFVKQVYGNNENLNNNNNNNNKYNNDKNNTSLSNNLKNINNIYKNKKTNNNNTNKNNNKK
tara:strand:+ start:6009 stop:6719 length:711 start_codon:yes stop_codon:yes gene_type:complete